MPEEKIQKVLQAAGIDSRRNIRQFFHDGRIKVNNRVIDDPNFLVDITRDTVRLDDKKLKLKIEKISYFLLNKPIGVMSTLNDPEGRSTIKDLIGKIKERVYPVGRLDYNSEGLMLLTNDGDLTNFIISPRNKIPKVYMVKIKGILADKDRNRLTQKGIVVDGIRVKPVRIDFIKKTGQGNSWIRITLYEGKKHVIRNMMKYSGHPVEKLKRTAIGSFRLGKMPSGHWREITAEELEEFIKLYKFKPPVSDKQSAKPDTKKKDTGEGPKKTRDNFKSN